MHIEYSATNEELRILASDSTKDSKVVREGQILLLSVPLRLQDHIKLDNGTAYLGFTHETQALGNLAIIENWSFVSQ